MIAEIEKRDVPLMGRPYDRCVSLGESVSAADVTAALKRGERGVVHSFTTGSAVDGPGGRLVARAAGSQFRCADCHSPDTWRMSDGTPISVKRAVEVVGQ